MSLVSAVDLLDAVLLLLLFVHLPIGFWPSEASNKRVVFSHRCRVHFVDNVELHPLELDQLAAIGLNHARQELALAKQNDCLLGEG